MSDQLSLDLDAALPHLPARLRPMLPRTVAAPFDDIGCLFEPSWGGLRALAFLEPAVDEGGVQGSFRTADGAPSLRVVDPGGRDLAGRLPELRELPLRVEARSAVLDGELVVADPTGRPDPAGLEARLAGMSGIEVAYLVFDVLYLDGRPLLGQPLSRRRETLRRILRPGGPLVTVPAIPGEGLALHDAVTAQGLAGVMARERTSPYLPGVRSRLWRWIAAGTVTASGGVIAVGGSAGADGADGASGGASGAASSVADGAAPDGTVPPDRPEGSPSAPVLALIRRLPLDEE